MRRAKIYMHNLLAGILSEDEDGYHFTYDETYLKHSTPEPISLTLPTSTKSHSSKILFPFFDGLIPEGFLLDIAIKNWKLNLRDRMGILLVTCKDCIGAVSVHQMNENG